MYNGTQDAIQNEISLSFFSFFLFLSLFLIFQHHIAKRGRPTSDLAIVCPRADADT